MTKREIVLEVARTVMLQDRLIAVEGDWARVTESLCKLPADELPTDDVAGWVTEFVNAALDDQGRI